MCKPAKYQVRACTATRVKVKVLTFLNSGKVVVASSNAGACFAPQRHVLLVYVVVSIKVNNQFLIGINRTEFVTLLAWHSRRTARGTHNPAAAPGGT